MIENGSDIIVIVDDNRVASLTANGIEPSREVRDTTTKDAPSWKTLEYGLGSWKMTADGKVLGSSKNLLLYSENLGNSVWSKSGCSVEAYYAAGTNGTIRAQRIYNLSSGDYVEQLLDGDLVNTVSQDVCFSFYAKGTGNIGLSIQDGSASESDSLTLTSSYQRIYVTFTSSGDSSDILPKISYSSATTVTIDGLQVEYGSVPSEYIPTGAQYSYLLDALKNKTKVTIKQTDLTTGNPVLSGTGVIDNLQLTAPMEDNVTFTCSITGDGSLTVGTI